MTDHSSAAFMTAAELAAQAPLGALIRFSDFTPEPPNRFKRKHAEWSRNNNTGRLICVRTGKADSETTITLHMGDYGAHGVIVISTRKTFMGHSSLRFAILEHPATGSVGIISDHGSERELLHLASTHDQAQDWLASNPHRTATLQIYPLQANA
jgi:hypothetical protein